MRRVLSMVLFVLCLSFAQAAAAAAYPDYLGGDRNYLFCGGHMGVGYYVDKSSLVVQKYAPPTYRIAVNVLSVEDADGGNTEPFRVDTRQYLYRWDSRAMYRWGEDSWQYIPPVGSNAETGHEFSGEMAFYIAYHMKFYGGQRWYNRHRGSYDSPNFSDHLYAVVDGSN